MSAGLFAVALAGGCAKAPRPDTAEVLLGRAGPAESPWSLVGWRRGGELCAALRDGSTTLAERCGAVAADDPERTWDVPSVAYSDRAVVFAPLPEVARRIRIDGRDGMLMVIDAGTAAGFPGRFLLTDLSGDTLPIEVRVFAGKGRPVVPRP